MSDLDQAARERIPANLFIALALLVSGSALWMGAALRSPAAFTVLPGVDGCLVTGVVGLLLAVLHGVPYRTAMLYLGTPIVVVQLAVTSAMGITFFPMLGIELVAFGLLGLPFSRLPRRPAAAREERSLGSSQPSPST
jgi:hypothetical protein